MTHASKLSIIRILLLAHKQSLHWRTLYDWVVLHLEKSQEEYASGYDFWKTHRELACGKKTGRENVITLQNSHYTWPIQWALSFQTHSSRGKKWRPSTELCISKPEFTFLTGPPQFCVNVFFQSQDNHLTARKSSFSEIFRKTNFLRQCI